MLRGAAIARETEESATQILSAPTTVMSATQATTVKPPPRRSAPPGYPPPPPPVYYDYDEPIRRRPIWPWLLALLFVIAAGIGGYFLYTQISSQISSDKPVAVDDYRGLRTPDAMAKIHGKGLRGKTDPQPSSSVAEGFVFGQSPDPGTRVNKGNQVTITVSTGKPKTDVPEIVGKSEADAVAALTGAKLEFKSLQVPSDQPAGQVLAQDPKPGVKVTEGTIVHFTVSKGPTPVAVPSVLGLNVATANSTLQGAGFKVGSQSIDSSQPKDTVVRQDPAGGSSAAKGTTVTIFVSKGPKTSTVPDVQSYDVTTAGQTLHAAGFNVHVTRQDTTDPSQDGIVLSQDPPGSTEAKPGTVVTLTVGRLVTQTDTTTTTP